MDDPRPYPFSRFGTQELLKADDTFAFVLMTILLAKYDTEFFDWETEVLAANVKDDFGVWMSEEAEDRVNAAITALTTDLPLQRFDVFKSTALAFAEGNIGTAEDREDEELNVCELIWTLYEIALLRGQKVSEVKAELSDNVVKKLNDIIDDEAEELDEVEEPRAEGVEAISEVTRDPYYNRYVQQSLVTLLGQLRKLHVPQEICYEIKTSFRQV